ncbi:MAG TPA: hypothetical protein DDZ51_04770 [Planctomycetaceae bacterium]|nr:hypothetical protein [Planctomycetaceae bacterium]
MKPGLFALLGGSFARQGTKFNQRRFPSQQYGSNILIRCFDEERSQDLASAPPFVYQAYFRYFRSLTPPDQKICC